MKIRIEIAVTKATTQRSIDEGWHKSFTSRIRKGTGKCDFLDFGPMTLDQDAINHLIDLIDFIRGPAIVHAVFVHEHEEDEVIEKVGE